MIHIIGSAHSLQIRSISTLNAAAGTAERLEEFEKYLQDATETVHATVIAEELSEERVLRDGPDALSVAKNVATRLSIRHAYCDPNIEERRAIGLKAGKELAEYTKKIAKDTGGNFLEFHSKEVRKNFETREAIWIKRLEKYAPNDTSVIFVCGADHVDTFRAALDKKGLVATVHCRDWTQLQG